MNRTRLAHLTGIGVFISTYIGLYILMNLVGTKAVIAFLVAAFGGAYITDLIDPTSSVTLD